MKVCNNGKMHREEKSMGETKAYTFKVKPQEDSNIYRLIQIDSGKTLDDLHSAILRAFDFTAETVTIRPMMKKEGGRIRKPFQGWAGS